MKILNVRLKNLNSLKGEHFLDLEAEPLASAGIFAITGSTGAGKTTLLDAITLALYGRAARYGSSPNPESIMTRHCGDCSAEVEFAVPAGRFRAVYQRRRARNTPDGKLQPSQRYVYDSEGNALAQQVREAESKIEELIGLNYDRFLRSALLAQGDFSRFLDSKIDERAGLLESLTGTEIYSRLGQLAHEESNRRAADVEEKERAIESIEVLSKEDRAFLSTEIKTAKKKTEGLRAELKAGAEMLEKIRALSDARAKEAKAAEDEVHAAQNRKEAAAQMERLALHKKAEPFGEKLTRLDGTRSALKSAVAKLEEAKAAAAEAEVTQRRADQVFRVTLESRLQVTEERAKEALATAAKQTEIETKAKAWLADHERDADLDEQLPVVVGALSEVKGSRKFVTDGWETWKKDAKRILPGPAAKLPASLFEAGVEGGRKAMDEFLAAAKADKDRLILEGTKAKDEAEQREDHLRKTLLIVGLEEHRHDLKDGESCPLCGSLEHPFADDAPTGDSEIRQLKQRLQEAKDHLKKLQTEFGQYRQEFKRLGESRDSFLDGITEAATKVNPLVKLLKPLGMAVPKLGEEDRWIDGLRDRNRAYRHQVDLGKESRERRIEAEAVAKEAQERTAELKARVEKLPALTTAVDRDVRPLSTVVEAEELYQQAVQVEKTTAAQVEDRLRDEKAARQAHEELRGPLQSALAASDFADLDALRGARLSTEEVESIEEEEKRLREQTAAIGALRKQAETDIKALRKAKVLEGDEAQTFRCDHEELSDQRDQLVEDLSGLRAKRKVDKERRQLRKEKRKELKVEQEKVAVWRTLRELIGSHDGAKFRRYAQGISLDILTRHANTHLAQLSSRYQIRRDPEEQLNLLIEDLHQAGATRPMASLSGGEKFLASLALALGLSDLAGRTVRIDSLFIDEGFGSLSAEYLEVALTALESLRQREKTVGVISHVELLKDRIGTQVVVEQEAGGHSKMRVIS